MWKENPMADQSSTFHILGRYPELAQNKDFIKWLRTYGGQVWHETQPNDDGNLTVVVQSNARLNMFAALLRRDISNADKGLITHKVVRTAEIDLTKQGVAQTAAVAAVLNQAGISNNNQVHAIRPVVDFRSDPPSVAWEVEVKDGNTIKKFRVDGPNKLVKLNYSGLTPVEPLNPLADELIPPTSDYLASNELHHLSTWRATAQQMVGSVTSPTDRAAAIFFSVRQRMAYDGNILNIDKFVWSDNLTINWNGWKGICDEWAVVQITLLRSLGIPAVLKFLTWHNGTESVAHACLEWSDNVYWRHMDALWNAFDNRAVYRENGAMNVTVMDADYPLDSRYNGLAWGAQDYPNDEKLYHYGDFLINPAYPGNQRWGYSY